MHESAGSANNGDNQMDLSQFHGVFFDEAAENLTSMEEMLLAIDSHQPSDDDLNAVFRCAHSIKGGAATFGFADLTELTHVMETLLDRLRRHELVLSTAMVDALLQSKDILTVMLGRHAGSGEPAPDSSTMAAALRRLADPASAGIAAIDVPGTNVAADPAREAVVQVTAARDAGHRNNSAVQGGTPLTNSAGQTRLLLTFTESVNDTAIKDALNLFDEVIGLGKIGRDQDQARRFVIETSTPIGEIGDLLGFHLSADQFSIVVDDRSAAASEQPASAAAANSAKAADAPESIRGGFEGKPVTGPDGIVEINDNGIIARPAALDGSWGLFAGAAGTPAEQAPATEAAVREAAETAGAKQGDPGAGERTPARAAANGAAARGDATLRVSVDKVDQLINLVGELVITQAMLAQNGRELDPMIHQQMTGTLADLERNTRLLQESVMAIRMIPMSVVFNRFPRMLRDLAKKLGKEVEMVTVGDATELDKGMIEKLSDPLTHLVRNAVDHAIEEPEARLAAGKKAVGTITLSAQHRGGSIVIEVRDDGRGLSRRKLLTKATERGLTASESMSDEEVWALIFEPGFSTAEVVTEVSGRGVGMDVVRKNIQALNGSVSISSAEGYGTCVSVRLPLTLAIMDGMSIGVGTDTYILPLDSVIESINLNPRQIKRVTESNRVLEIRGEYIPILPLEDVVPVEREPGKPGNTTVIVFEAEGKRVALMVDELIGQHQIVVKNLERNYRKVPGISGATIMGDGRVALILDVAYLVRRARH